MTEDDQSDGAGSSLVDLNNAKILSTLLTPLGVIISLKGEKKIISSVKQYS